VAAADLLVSLGIVVFLAAVVMLGRMRERQIRLLLRAHGKTATASVTEYAAGEDGYNVSYEFTPIGRSTPIVRTEALPSRPLRHPAVGERVSVEYLPSLPSVSRAGLAHYCNAQP
jgi:hypothetical protein